MHLVQDEFTSSISGLGSTHNTGFTSPPALGSCLFTLGKIFSTPRQKMLRVLIPIWHSQFKHAKTAANPTCGVVRQACMPRRQSQPGDTLDQGGAGVAGWKPPEKQVLQGYSVTVTVLLLQC